MSRSLISAIEAPGLANGFSLEVFINIADALEVDPARSDQCFRIPGSVAEEEIRMNMPMCKDTFYLGVSFSFCDKESEEFMFSP